MTDTPTGLRTLQRLLRLVLKIATNLHAEGLDYLPEEGPAIITPNHVVWSDVLYVGAFIKGAPVAMAAEKWENYPFIGWVLSHFGQAIFVQRGEVDRGALLKAMRHLRNGGVLALAPEGTRSYTGELGHGHSGAAWLAAKTDASIIPIAVWGHDRLWESYVKLRRPRVHVVIGPPHRLPPEAQRAKSRELEPYTYQIMHQIALLLPPDRRGDYG